MFQFLFGWLSSKAVLQVHLDLALDPQVVISDPNLKASGKKIRWKRNDDVHEFDFKRLNDLNQAYFNRQSIDLDRQQIRCNNRAPNTNEAFPYEIVVSWNGNDYSSTKSGAPPGGKPVIRNK